MYLNKIKIFVFVYTEDPWNINAKVDLITCPKSYMLTNVKGSFTCPDKYNVMVQGASIYRHI